MIAPLLGKWELKARPLGTYITASLRRNIEQSELTVQCSLNKLVGKHSKEKKMKPDPTRIKRQFELEF